jgi:phosphatidylglycerol:prolipoprotein diacylglycerol transferase
MYGFMIVLGALFGITIASFRGKKYNISKDDIIFSSCYAGIGLVFGAKLLYIITIIPDITKNWDKILADVSLLLPMISGGFVFYGGLIGAVIGYYLYCRQYHINLLDLLDLITPSVPIIHGFGRLGCFFAGCCYGIPYDGKLHIIFDHSPVAPNNTPLFPVQLTESFINLIAGIILLIYARKFRRPGQVLGLYLEYYAVMRFILEYFRGDIQRGIILGFSTSQWISLALIPIGLWFYLKADKSRLHSEL